MSMLAERKQKQRWSLNPRGKLWTEDSTKFGQKMLEKMGWKHGKGLGANESGMTEHVKIGYKNDQKGIGYKETEQWTEHDDAFNQLLKNLNGDSDRNDAGTKLSSLHKKAKGIKARINYHKFTKGKDLSLYSNKDLANIFGKKSLKPKSPEPQENNGNEVKSEEVLINRGSITEYFKKKLPSFGKLNISGLRIGNNGVLTKKCATEMERPSFSFESQDDANCKKRKLDNSPILPKKYAESAGLLQREKKKKMEEQPLELNANVFSEDSVVKRRRKELKNADDCDNKKSFSEDRIKKKSNKKTNNKEFNGINPEERVVIEETQAATDRKQKHHKKTIENELEEEKFETEPSSSKTKRKKPRKIAGSEKLKEQEMVSIDSFLNEEFEKEVPKKLKKYDFDSSSKEEEIEWYRSEENSHCLVGNKTKPAKKVLESESSKPKTKKSKSRSRFFEETSANDLDENPTETGKSENSVDSLDVLKENCDFKKEAPISSLEHRKKRKKLKRHQEVELSSSKSSVSNNEMSLTNENSLIDTRNSKKLRDFVTEGKEAEEVQNPSKLNSTSNFGSDISLSSGWERANEEDVCGESRPKTVKRTKKSAVQTKHIEERTFSTNTDDLFYEETLPEVDNPNRYYEDVKNGILLGSEENEALNSDLCEKSATNEIATESTAKQTRKKLKQQEQFEAHEEAAPRKKKHKMVKEIVDVDDITEVKKMSDLECTEGERQNAKKKKLKKHRNDTDTNLQISTDKKLREDGIVNPAFDPLYNKINIDKHILSTIEESNEEAADAGDANERKKPRIVIEYENGVHTPFLEETYEVKRKGSKKKKQDAPGGIENPSLDISDTDLMLNVTTTPILKSERSTNRTRKNVRFSDCNEERIIPNNYMQERNELFDINTEVLERSVEDKGKNGGQCENNGFVNNGFDLRSIGDPSFFKANPQSVVQTGDGYDNVCFNAQSQELQEKVHTMSRGLENCEAEFDNDINEFRNSRYDWNQQYTGRAQRWHRQDTAQRWHRQDTAERWHRQDTAQRWYRQDTAQRWHRQDTGEMQPQYQQRRYIGLSDAPSANHMPVPQGVKLGFKNVRFGKSPPWMSRMETQAKASYKHLIRGDIILAFKSTNLHEIIGYAVTQEAAAS